PDSSDNKVHRAIGVSPDFLGGCAAVNLSVCLISELTGQDGSWALGSNLISGFNRAGHATGTRSQDELGTKRAQEGATFLGHGLRHCQNNVVAAGRSNHGERNTGVTGG